MSRIVLPNEESNDSTEEQEIKYKPTERDEKNFFLMYHYNWAPSEVINLDEDYIDWLIARTFAQKEGEREMMQRMRLMNEIGPNLKVT